MLGVQTRRAMVCDAVVIVAPNEIGKSRISRCASFKIIKSLPPHGTSFKVLQLK